MRVGVTSGEALVSHDPAGGVDAVGDVVNTAARLESAAPLGGLGGWVDVSGDRAAIRYEAAEAVAAKGKSEPVEAWVAVAPRSIVPEQCGSAACRWSAATPRPICWTMRLTGRGRSPRPVGDVIGSRDRQDPTGRELLDYVEELPELITWRRGRSLG